MSEDKGGGEVCEVRRRNLPAVEARLVTEGALAGLWRVDDPHSSSIFLLTDREFRRDYEPADPAAPEPLTRQALEAADHALEELANHHCGGYCGDDEEARGYRKHSDVMAETSAALALIRRALGDG